MAAKTKTIRPVILTSPRCISPSNATMLMRSNGENERALLIRKIGARGVQSSAGVANEKKIEANPQEYECAFLESDANQLVVSFDVDFSAVGELSAVSDVDYRNWMASFVEKYREKTGFKELGFLYAWNLANGRFLWRNQRNAHKVEVKITLINENGQSGSEFSFIAGDISQTTPPDDNQELFAIRDYIADGLSGVRKFASIRVEAVVTGSYGREVFPSQSMIMDSGRSKLSKHLFCIEDVKGERRAGMHSQKIGNAIRTIDMWYAPNTLSPPIAVEVYGTVSSQAYAYRPAGNDFYTLIDAAKKAHDAKKDDLGALNDSDLHYVFAVLVRGGVFNSGKE